MKPIDSLDDLRKAKRAIKLERLVTRQVVKENLSSLQRQTGKTLLKKVMIPGGLALLTSLGIKALLKSKHPQEAPHQNTFTEDGYAKHKDRWLGYLDILLSVLKIYQGMSNKISSPK